MKNEDDVEEIFSDNQSLYNKLNDQNCEFTLMQKYSKNCQLFPIKMLALPNTQIFKKSFICCFEEINSIFLFYQDGIHQLNRFKVNSKNFLCHSAKVFFLELYTGGTIASAQYFRMC